MTVANTIMLLGGLGFFLFGMSLLGEGLKRVAGSKLEMILEKLTSTTFKGVLLGTLVTAVIQSSSATTVMVVGFVNSGIMKLSNAIGIIMGANIGTTATGWLLVLADVEGSGLFSSATMFAFISFVGIILYFFCKKPKQKNVGMIMLAFAVLMSGMQSMSGAMAPLKESPAFVNFISAVSNPVIAIIVGVIVTAIIQSCSASIGILQALSITGVINYQLAVPMVVGMCIGACVPVLLSAIGANVNGKRAAFVYLYFNLAAAVIVLIPFYILNAVIGFEFMSAIATSIGIAIVNTVFKVTATAILTPAAPVLEKLSNITIRDKYADDDDDYEETSLDERLLDYPSVALEQCGKTMLQMGRVAFKNLNRAMKLLDDFKQEKYEKVLRREDRVDKYEDRLGAYLVRITSKELTVEETQMAARCLSCLGNLERVSDHAVNIAELAKELDSKNEKFSENAARELMICRNAVCEITELTRIALEENNSETAKKVEPLEEVVDALTKELKLRHIQRVQMGKCTLELGFVFNDCVMNLERVADHCSNIAVALLEAKATGLQTHSYLRSVKQTANEDYRVMLSESAKKYYDALAEMDPLAEK